MLGALVLLGQPQRRQQAIIIYSTTDNQHYSSAPTTVRVLNARRFYQLIKQETYVFIVAALLLLDNPLLEEIKDFLKMFTNKKDVTKLQRVNGAKYIINLQVGKKLPFRPLYNLSSSELKLLQKYLDQALRNGQIQRSISKVGTPILFVLKKDGTFRLYVNYQGLNDITVKDRYPLPFINKTLTRLRRVLQFSKLDLKNAYYRIPIKKDVRQKTTFRTRYGYFEYLVIPFSLTNAPATFQVYINRALAGLVDVYYVVYLDDILIYSNIRKEYTQYLRLIIERLKKYALYASRKKYEFYTYQLEFLGFIINGDGVLIDKRKLAVVKEQPILKTLKEVQSFLGFANFYQRFIKNYSKIASPFTSITKGKGGPFNQGDLKEATFRKLILAFTTAPILRYYNPSLLLRTFGLDHVLLSGN